MICLCCSGPAPGGGGWPCAGGGLAQAQSCKTCPAPHCWGWALGLCRAQSPPLSPRTRPPALYGGPSPGAWGLRWAPQRVRTPHPIGKPGGGPWGLPRAGAPLLGGLLRAGCPGGPGGSRGLGAVSPVSPGCGEGGAGLPGLRQGVLPGRSPRGWERAGKEQSLAFPGCLPSWRGGWVWRRGGHTRTHHAEPPHRKPAVMSAWLGSAGSTGSHVPPLPLCREEEARGGRWRGAEGHGGARSSLCSRAVRDEHERGPAPASPRCLAEPAGSDLGAGGRGRRRLQGAASLRERRSPSPGVTGLLLPQELRPGADSRGRGCARLAETLPGMGQPGGAGDPG